MQGACVCPNAGLMKLCIGILHVNDAIQEKNLGNEADFKTILDHLQAVYCGKIAYEFMHLPVSSVCFSHGPASGMKWVTLAV